MKLKTLLWGLMIFATISCTPTPSSETSDSVQSIIENQNLSAYHGWIKYLLFDVEQVANRSDITPEQKAEKEQRLNEWLTKLQNESVRISDFRGPIEWAYESQADGSGQPFMITIPQDYDPNTPFPLDLYMHGLSGNHSEHYNGSADLKGIIEVSVLGRSRGGGYVGLSEVDVLDVLAYVRTHWNIDENQIHIKGGSMGGNGTFRMGSRYPHLFASARPTCGFASDKPYGNLFTLPVYATHSDDDFVVPIQHAMGITQKLKDIGAPVIFDTTTGLGHASWNYAEGNQRSGEWFKKQQKPASKTITHINYTALDGMAKRAWWTEIETWGDEPIPAQFVIDYKTNNRLEVKLSNINELKLDLELSPINRDKPLSIVLNQAQTIEVNVPIPTPLYIKKKKNEWIANSDTDEIIKHTPGGPNLLYDGKPLLIVYGTQGSQEENEAMLNAAQVASENSNGMWQQENGDKAKDGFYHHQLLYGNLTVKSDNEISKKEVKNSHIVLIGSAKQNSLTAQLAKDLPVSFTDHKITFSDGETMDAMNKALGLVYLNPKSENHLIFWLASNEINVYSANSALPTHMSFSFPTYASSNTGYDCLVMTADKGQIVTSRSFDSNWNWIQADKNTKVSSRITNNATLNQSMAKAIKKATKTDYSYTLMSENPEGLNLVIPGETSIYDLAIKYMYEPVGVFTVTGEELLLIQEKLHATGQSLYPTPQMISDLQQYTISLNQFALWPLVRTTQMILPNYVLTDIQLRDVVLNHFPNE